MSGRSIVVLSRFPAHLDAARPGKQLRVVADSASSSLDDLSTSLAGVRRSHRIGHADATSDIRLHGALHRIGIDDFAPLELRVARLHQAAADLTAAADDTARDAAAEALCDLLAISAPPPRLALFAPPVSGGAPPDLTAAAQALAAATLALTSYTGTREAYRARVVTECGIHSRGNGTVSALLESATSALDLEIDDDRTDAFKEQLRPVVSIAQTGAAGTTPYSYVVIARSLSKSVDRQSAVATTVTGNATLSTTDANVIAWTLPPDARDFLVFRVANGADAAQVGLLTPVGLDATTTTFTDTGQAVTAGDIDPEVDDRFSTARIDSGTPRSSESALSSAARRRTPPRRTSSGWKRIRCGASSRRRLRRRTIRHRSAPTAPAASCSKCTAEGSAARCFRFT